MLCTCPCRRLHLQDAAGGRQHQRRQPARLGLPLVFLLVLLWNRSGGEQLGPRTPFPEPNPSDGRLLALRGTCGFDCHQLCSAGTANLWAKQLYLYPLSSFAMRIKLSLVMFSYTYTCIAVQSFAKLADSIFFQVPKCALTLIRLET